MLCMSPYYIEDFYNRMRLHSVVLHFPSIEMKLNAPQTYLFFGGGSVSIRGSFGSVRENEVSSCPTKSRDVRPKKIHQETR